jgi:hypothetical protein
MKRSIHVRCRRERRAARRSTFIHESGSLNVSRGRLQVSPMGMSGRTALSDVMPIVPSRQRASLPAQHRLRRPVSNKCRMHAVLSLQDSVPSSQCLTRRHLIRILLETGNRLSLVFQSSELHPASTFSSANLTSQSTRHPCLWHARQSARGKYCSRTLVIASSMNRSWLHISIRTVTAGYPHFNFSPSRFHLSSLPDSIEQPAENACKG